jgi:hypothetical protein
MVKAYIPTASSHGAAESDDKKFIGGGLRSSPSPRLVWGMAAVVGVAAIAAAVRMLSAPSPVHAAPPVPAAGARQGLAQETSDSDAARAICSDAVARMIGEPAADHLAARTTFPVATVEPGVLTVEVRMRESNVANASREPSFRCQATNQTGRWETESISEVHR